MGTAKHAFDSACQIGVSKSYNYKQLSQVFMGVNEAISGVVSSGVGNIYASGQLPDGTVDGQLGLVQKEDGGYYVYVWIDDRWEAINIKTFDVTPETFVNISGADLANQRDINYYLDNRIDQVALGSGGVTYELLTDEPNPTIDLLNSDGVKTSVTYTTTGSLTFNSVSGAIVVDSSSIDSAIAGLVDFDLLVVSGFTELSGNVTALESDVSTISGRVDDLEVTRGADKLYHFDTIGLATAIRAGDLVVNNAAAADVSYISIAPLDENNNPAPLVEAGDLIDLEVSGVTNRYLALSGTTDAQTIFCGYVQGTSTFVSGGNVTVYAYPQNSDSASLEYVNEELAKKADITYVDTQDNLRLSKSGGTMTGGLTFASGAIFAASGLSNLSGRASLKLSPVSDRPIAISTGSSYKPALAIFAYDGSAPDNRGQVMEFTGRGDITLSGIVHCPKAPTGDDNLTNKAYVDSKLSAGGGTISGDITLSQNTLIKSEVDPLINIQVSDAIYHRGTSRFQRTFLTGNLDTNSLIKSTRNSGYAFQVKPDDVTPVAYIHTNGNAEFVNVVANTLDCSGNVAFVSGEITGLYSSSNNNVRYELTGAHNIRGNLDVAHTDGDQSFKANNNYVDIFRTTRISGTFNVKAQGEAIGGNNIFSASSTAVTYAGPITSNNHIATKSYVDSQLNPTLPAGYAFKFGNATTSTAFGKFNYYADGGNLRLRINKQLANGINWLNAKTEDYNFSEGHMFTITHVVDDSNWKQIRTGTFNRVDYHTGDILVYVTSHKTNGSFVSNDLYYIQLAGIMA